MKFSKTTITTSWKCVKGHSLPPDKFCAGSCKNGECFALILIKEENFSKYLERIKSCQK